MKTVTNNSMKLATICVLGALISVSQPDFGQTDPLGSNGFELKVSKSTSKTTNDLSKAFVNDIGKWWSKDHTWSGESANLSIDLKNCVFVETLPNGGFCRHLSLEHYESGKLLRFTGALGPLKELGMNGTLTIQFDEIDGKGVVEAKYVLHGFSKNGFEGLAPVVQKVLDQQFERLVKYVETGSPEKVESTKAEKIK